MRTLTVVVVAVAITALFALLDFVAAIVIYDWAGGDFGGYGASARSPAGWAVPLWVILTFALVALDVFIVRSVHRKTSVR